MTDSIILVGGPDTGKTNFLARLVAHLRDGKGGLSARNLPEDMRYIEDALAFLMRGEFAPRSHNTTEELSGDITINLQTADGASLATLNVPDVSGETWDEVARSALISQNWLDRVQEANGALLFVRVLSDLNVMPMDWVNAPQLFAAAGNNEHAFQLPTQVLLCTLLRLLEEHLTMGSEPPRVAVVVTAYDRLDRETREKGPLAFLESAFPLFAGKIANTSGVEIGVFGASVVGGELADGEFKATYLDGDLVESGYVMDGTESPPQPTPDVTRPVSWVMRL